MTKPSMPDQTLLSLVYNHEHRPTLPSPLPIQEPDIFAKVNLRAELTLINAAEAPDLLLQMMIESSAISTLSASEKESLCQEYAAQLLAACKKGEIKLRDTRTALLSSTEEPWLRMEARSITGKDIKKFARKYLGLEILNPVVSSETTVDESHPNFPEELGLAIKAWNAIKNTSTQVPKKAATAWLIKSHSSISEGRLDRISTLVNWKSKGGPPSTPNLKSKKK